MSVSPEEIRDYLLDDLPSQRRAAVEAALRSDPQARKELEVQRRLLGALRSLPEAEVPEHSSFVPDPVPAVTARPASSRWGAGYGFRLAAVCAAVLVGLFGAVWLSQPTVQRLPDGWIVSFGGAPKAPVPPGPAVSEEQLRAAIREEIERSSARWASALIEVSASAAGAEGTEAEVAALRQEVAAMHADSVAAYRFLNAKHELLKRQLLEFDLAAIPETRP